VKSSVIRVFEGRIGAREVREDTTIDETNSTFPEIQIFKIHFRQNQ